VQAVKTIIKKELADHFASYRFTIIFALIAMVSLITAYMVGLNIRKELEGIAKPQFIFLMLFTSSGSLFSLVQFVAFFGPLVGLVLGFDTINRERSEGTLSKLLSQPIYRDVVINGKFLAGVIMISVMMVSIVLVTTGLGLIVLGIIPGWEEIWRIFIYLVISIIYISFWLGVAILFSILFRSTATSALAALAVWIFFSFFVSLGASVLANAFASDTTDNNPQTVVRQAKIIRAIILTSPMELYTHGCNGNHHRSDPQTCKICSEDGARASGKLIYGALCRPAAPASESPDRGALYHFADRSDSDLFCHFLHRLHAPGNPIAIKFENSNL